MIRSYYYHYYSKIGMFSTDHQFTSNQYQQELSSSRPNHPPHFKGRGKPTSRISPVMPTLYENIYVSLLSQNQSKFILQKFPFYQTPTKITNYVLLQNLPKLYTITHINKPIYQLISQIQPFHIIIFNQLQHT
ncbi:unnamed protein product [Cuscuta epithymum]|uniref:Uncharacterized protein n=1 Tax=Cuscuta epithymum TaxID=186058 RepID=A0AAV0FIG9_9ASTE|nr:unnamed protein product [Cuscuta epithymum]